MLCAYENIHIVYAQYKFHIYYYYLLYHAVLMFTEMALRYIDENAC